jgi:hypothetical protein
MTLASPNLATSGYEWWHRYFMEHREGSGEFCWNCSDTLSAAERRLVARSIQQFQLGEYAHGRGLRRRASSDPILAGDPWFVPALELFIAEEQEHSRILGCFLDHERIPRLSRHWLDGIFRRLRKLAGLELCATVLVTAEVLAMPFYLALRDATRSTLLRAICSRILLDEAGHLKFQALTLGLLRSPLSDRAREIHARCHSLLFRGTALILWQQHRRVFRAAGWDFRRFWEDAGRWFALLEFRIREVTGPPRLLRSCTGSGVPQQN